MRNVLNLWWLVVLAWLANVWPALHDVWIGQLRRSLPPRLHPCLPVGPQGRVLLAKEVA